MNETNFSDPTIFLATTFFTFLAIFFRYVILAGILDLVFYVFLKDKFAIKKISTKPRGKKILVKELVWSGITSLIFAFTGVIMLILWQNGYTKVYIDLDAYPWWNYPLSICFFLLIHETYYYWLHRWMHKPAVFKLVHKAHHESITPSPWSAFSFHPLEGLLQAFVLPLFLLIYPMHYSAIVLLLVLMTVSSFINHLNIEIYPSGFEKNIIGKWLIGATHHTLHHTKFTANYGLYFTFWDKWMHTESAEYQAVLERFKKSKLK
ncbi:MAG: sterol desaturase [Thalassobius sp.]|nr:sterol desaturase [Thalassovita sp.]